MKKTNELIVFFFLKSHLRKQVDEVQQATSSVITCLNNNTSYSYTSTKRNEFEAILFPLDHPLLSRVVYELNILVNGRVSFSFLKKLLTFSVLLSFVSNVVIQQIQRVLLNWHCEMKRRDRTL